MTAESVFIVVGSRIKFSEERQSYTVQAASERYVVCTKPFNARKTVLYTIVDRWQQVRGRENLVFCAGFETREKCQEALERLHSDEDPSEVSHRHQIPLRVDWVKAA